MARPRVATARGRGRQGIAWNPQRACQFEPRRQRRGVGIDVADDGKHLPTIIFPHGGPYARDTDEFDYWTEYFVSRGHAVLQPNFRGSVGYKLYMYQFGKFTRARIARGDALDANSPIEHVDEFGIPLLIVHGDQDRSVFIEQSANLVAALEKAGKPYQYIFQPGGDHYLSRASQRLQFFEAMDAFLRKYLGPPRADPPAG
jgi:dipeptidyl aminopeptidase/acylaminoacyl peptidase